MMEENLIAGEAAAAAAFITDFWSTEYLDNYTALGGSKIKFITGRAGSGKTVCLEHFLRSAAVRNYQTALLSGRTTWINDFKCVYAAVLAAVDLPGCLARCADQIIVAMGFSPSEMEPGESFADYLSRTGQLTPLTRRELREQLHGFFLKNPRVDNNFALACSILTGGLLGYPLLEAPNRELLLNWLAGAPGVHVPAMRKLGLSPVKVTKFNARHMLRSLVEVLKQAGYAGLVVGVDDLDILLGDSGLEELRYTKLRREDAYESIRELIDDIDTLTNFMVVFALDRRLLDDEDAGFKSYQALWMRIQNEIESDSFNRFADIIDMDKLRAWLCRPDQGAPWTPPAGAADFYSRRVVESLRSGIASREAGRCFSSARPHLLRQVDEALDKVCDTRAGAGMIVSGKYGEGKTHLLNTIISMAGEKNMVFSLISVSKETPLDKLHLLYPKIIQGTYLPGHVQPGFAQILNSLSLGAPVASSLLEYALTATETDKLYYLLKSYLGSGDEEEKFLLLADLEGDFMGTNTLKGIFRRVYREQASFRVPFAKTRHVMDYLSFLSHLFLQSGYGGWVILFDESELIGRFGKKTRLKAYANMASFLRPARTEGLFSVFAFNSAYIPDVLEAKQEFANLEEAVLPPETKEAIAGVLNALSAAPQLAPLGGEELLEILRRIWQFHSAAYDWTPKLTAQELLNAGEKRGYLLRTKIRAAIEILDQLYQYDETQNVRISELGQLTFDEEVSLDGLLEED